MKKLVILLLILLSGSILAQNGARLIDFNAKSAGRGGTSIGTFDSNVLMLTNPAGISFIENTNIDFNFSLMVPSLHFKNTINDKDGESNLYPMPSLSFVKKSESKLTWGVGVFTVGGMGAEFNLSHPLFQEEQEYYSNFGYIYGGPTVAYKFSDKLSVGASAYVVYSMMDFRMPYSLNPLALQGVVPGTNGMTFGQLFAAPQNQGGFGYSEVTAYTRMDDLTGIGFNGKLGLAYKVNDKFSLGVSFSTKTALNLENGKAKMDMSNQFNEAFGLAVQGAMAQGLSMEEAQQAVMQQFTQMGIDVQSAMQGVVSEYDMEADLNLPMSIGFGASYAPKDNLKLSFDFEWLNWSDAFDKMQLTMTNGTNANVETMMGSNDLTIDFPLNWDDTFLIKLGAEYGVSDIVTLRAGYVYGSNPVPDETVFPVFPAIVENHLTLGGSFKLNDKISLHAAFETALNKEQTGASNNIIANEYKNAVNELQNILGHISLSWNL